LTDWQYGIALVLWLNAAFGRERPFPIPQISPWSLPPPVNHGHEATQPVRSDDPPPEPVPPRTGAPRDAST